MVLRELKQPFKKQAKTLSNVSRVESSAPLLGLPQKIQASELTGLTAPQVPQVTSETRILP